MELEETLSVHSVPYSPKTELLDFNAPEPGTNSEGNISGRCSGHIEDDHHICSTRGEGNEVAQRMRLRV